MRAALPPIPRNALRPTVDKFFLCFFPFYPPRKLVTKFRRVCGRWRLEMKAVR